jgi:hypothetical protein
VKVVRLAIGLAVLLLAAAACIPEPPPPPQELAPAPAPPPPPVLADAVIVYGDSFVVEAAGVMQQRLSSVVPGTDVIIRAFGGTAQCDYHDQMQIDANERRIRAVVIAFTGNNLSPCIQSRPLAAGYSADAEWAATFWRDRGVPLVFVAAPGAIGTGLAQRVVPNAYVSVGAARGVPVAESTPYFGQGSPLVYSTTMPCLVDECEGTIAVRRADGHICLVPTGGLPCPQYASGVERYVETAVQSVAARLGIPAPPPRALVPPSTTTTSTTTTAPATTSSSTTTTTSTSTTSTTTTTTTLALP